MKEMLLDLLGRLPVIRDIRAIERRLVESHVYTRLISTTAFIQAIEALKAGDERYRDPKRLLAHGAQCWSQNLEDGMIAEIFRRIGTTSKTFLEIGVGDGSENNTTLLLASGWKGWWLDADQVKCDAVVARLKTMPKAARRLAIKQAFVSPDNINGLLTDLGVPNQIDLFSLDIDLNTYHIWAALDKFRPRVVVVEYNGAFPPEQEWIHPFMPDSFWDHSQAFGASLKSFEILGARYGYSLVGCDITGLNAFFVRSDLVKNHFVGPFTSENHFEPPRYYLCHRLSHRGTFYVENDLEK